MELFQFNFIFWRFLLESFWNIELIVRVKQNAEINVRGFSLLGDGLGMCKFSYGAKEMMLDNAQKVTPQTTYHCVN